jgi:uncharacterized caspase-like protein
MKRNRTRLLAGGARRALLVLAALATAAPVPVLSQDRGSREIGRPTEEKDGDIPISRYVFAGVGIDAYDAPWEPLDNAVNDVDSVRAVFVDEFGFDSPDEWVLHDAAATKSGIEAMIDDLANNLERDDALVFFYAGHGDSRDLEFEGEVVGSSGYIVPSSVKAPLSEAPRQYIRINDLLEWLSELPARHVFVILDSCHSGLALGGLKTRGAMTQQARTLMSRQSRRVLTSAQGDEKAADGGARFAGNSLFTGWLIEGLRRAARGAEDSSNDVDPDENGLITASEIHTFVSGVVGAASESRQTPDYGAFSYDDRGELVLVLEGDEYQEAYESAIAAYNELKDDVFDEAFSTALELQPDRMESAYLRYLDVEFDDFLERGTEVERLTKRVRALTDLNAFAEAGSEVPLEGLTMALAKATRQCRKAGCDLEEGN